MQPIFFGRDALVAKAAEQLAARRAPGRLSCWFRGERLGQVVARQCRFGAAADEAAAHRGHEFSPPAGLPAERRRRQSSARLVEALVRGPAGKGSGLPELLAPRSGRSELAAHLAVVGECAALLLHGRVGARDRRRPRSRQAARLRAGQAHPGDRSARGAVHHRRDRRRGAAALRSICSRLGTVVARSGSSRRCAPISGIAPPKCRIWSRSAKAGPDRRRGAVGGGTRRDDPQARAGGRSLLRGAPE